MIAESLLLRSADENKQAVPDAKVAAEVPGVEKLKHVSQVWQMQRDMGPPQRGHAGPECPRHTMQKFSKSLAAIFFVWALQGGEKLGYASYIPRPELDSGGNDYGMESTRF
jgi:hypothetical protein